MRHIEKAAPPDELVSYRKEEASFDGFPHKEPVRRALAREQGHLCCYCLRRIEADGASMKIEHRVSQTLAPERRYDWTNLLGACPGGTAGHAQHQTCDTSKGATPITVDPTESAHVARVRFLGDGTVYSNDAAIQRDLHETLNLNDTTLVDARKKTTDARRRAFQQQHPGQWTRTQLQRELERWRPQRVTGRLPEFCEAFAQELDRRLQRRA